MESIAICPFWVGTAPGGGEKGAGLTLVAFLGTGLGEGKGLGFLGACGASLGLWGAWGLMGIVAPRGALSAIEM